MMERKNSIFRRNPDVRIVSNEQITIEIEKVAEFGQVRRRGYQYAGLYHATKHRLQARLPRFFQGLDRAGNAPRLCQFDVDPMKTFGGVICVLVERKGFISKNRQR